MQNLKRNRSKMLTKLLICQQFLNNFSKNNRLEPKKRSFLEVNKRHLRADVLSLLSSALRPRLLGRDSRKPINFANFAHYSNIPNCAKSVFRNANRGRKTPNVVKIVALSTILGISGLFSFTSSTPIFADSLTLTIPSSPLSLDLNPSVDNGFASTSGSFNVKTINSSGYTVSIKSKNEDGSNSLVSGENKLNSITEATTEETFKSDSKFTNMWGWLPNKLNSEDNSSYQVAPGIEEAVLDKTEEANDTGTDYNISLAAKVASDTPTGKYENTFVVSATSNELPPDGIMQDWDGCDSLEPEQSVRLLDNRDNNVYTVTKLKDGKCWMTENLRITGDSVKAAGNSATLDSTNTDINEGGKFIIRDSNLSRFDVGSSGWKTTTGKNNDAAYVTTTSYTDSVHGAKNFESGYYTWHTATAGTGTADQTTEGWNAPSSICPKGWKLPTSGSGGDFETLTNAYGISNSETGSNTLRGEPLNFTYAGSVDYSDGVLGGQGSIGGYWSSTVYNEYYVSYLLVNSSHANPGVSDYRASGLSVRCIKKEKTISDLQYMQDWDALSDSAKERVISSMEEGKNYTLTDKRDNTQYTVSKLQDGEIWMTQNLRIGSNEQETVLKSDTSDVASDFTLPVGTTKRGSSSTDTSGWYWAQYDTAHIYINSDTNYGGYYTWFAATAGEGTESKSSGDTSHSICPKGWRLPTNTEMTTLTQKYNTTTKNNNPPNFGIYPGYCDEDGCPRNQDSYGYWWSSTAFSSSIAYLLFSDSSNFGRNYVDLNRTKGFGHSVRCVARKPKTISDLQYMQDWDALSPDEKTQVTNSMEDGKNYTLTDKRDNVQYTVSKLQDGEVWMTQNLRIGSNEQETVLKSDTSDVASDFTLPAGTTQKGSISDKSGWDYLQYGTSHIYINSDTNYGGYYTWFAATAGEGTESKSSGDTSHSICPKGWRLPTSAGITTLTEKYDTTTRNNNPPNFGSTVWAGVCDEDGCPHSNGSYGHWWSSTASNSTSAYALYSRSLEFRLSSGGGKGFGYSVRCVARKPSE